MRNSLFQEVGVRATVRDVLNSPFGHHPVGKRCPQYLEPSCNLLEDRAFGKDDKTDKKRIWIPDGITGQ